MINGISLYAASSYLNDIFPSEQKNSCPSPKSKKAPDPWVENPICKSVSDSNCCCSGYSIEAILDGAYEAGLENNTQVKRLEKYPCITCFELDSIADQLVPPVSDKTDKELSVERLKDLESISDFAKALEEAEGLGKPLSQNWGAYLSQSKGAHSPARSDR